ncbi:MAG: ATP-binding cassette domain-containing protein, partial [Rhizobiales bacterium]|nr:ATP-binding cassette domain-containing protein [Hyphomicrobiales bacterium]
GPNGAGKSTFLRLIGGGDIPSSGRIVRTSRVSWPMGLTPGVLANLSGGENTRFACRIYGMTAGEIRETIERVRELADIGKFFDMPVGTYSSGMRQRLSFAITMSMKFDYYLFDEISAGGDLGFQKQARDMVQERLNQSNFILVSHSLPEILRHCQSAILLGGGELKFFDDAREAIEAYVLAHGTPEDLTNLKSNAAKSRVAFDNNLAPPPAAPGEVRAETAVPLKPAPGRQQREALRKEQEAIRQVREEMRAERRRQRGLTASGNVDEAGAPASPAGALAGPDDAGEHQVLRQARLERRARTLNRRKVSSPASAAAAASQLKR